MEERFVPRRKLLLDASIGVFSRFWDRKTSMSDIARAVGFSRQDLYFYCANSIMPTRTIFRATVHHFFASTLDSVSEILEDESGTVVV